MATALQIPRKRVEEGSDDEPLTCQCDHEFTRSRLDLMVRVEEFTYSGTPEHLADVTAWEVLKGYATVRSECPTCTCCSLEDGTIVRNEPYEDEQWLCTGCGKLHDDEEDALDCCG